jgi:hypothetical protein
VRRFTHEIDAQSSTDSLGCVQRHLTVLKFERLRELLGMRFGDSATLPLCSITLGGRTLVTENTPEA